MTILHGEGLEGVVYLTKNRQRTIIFRAHPIFYSSMLSLHTNGISLKFKCT